MGAANLITNVYNGRTRPSSSARPRWPSSAGATRARRRNVRRRLHRLVRGAQAQSLLLKAAKKLIDSGRLPNIHCLLVGEGPDKEMLMGLIDELKIGAYAPLCDFTKALRRLRAVRRLALPSTGKEGRPTCCSRRSRWRSRRHQQVRHARGRHRRQDRLRLPVGRCRRARRRHRQDRRREQGGAGGDGRARWSSPSTTRSSSSRRSSRSSRRRPRLALDAADRVGRGAF